MCRTNAIRTRVATAAIGSAVEAARAAQAVIERNPDDVLMVAIGAAEAAI